MKFRNLATWATIAAFSAPAFAAIQGEMSGTSSSAIFKNVFGETLQSGRQIQVTMLKDAFMGNDSPQLEMGGDGNLHGVRDKFCVIDTTGSNVQVKLTPTNLDVNDWHAKSLDGAYHQYYMTIGKTGGPYTRIERYQTYQVKAAAKDELECKDGNMEKGLHAFPDLGLNKSYVDTIILTVSPL